MAEALAAGADYLDMAMSLSHPHPDEPYARTHVKLGDEQFARASEWEKAGRLALLGIGAQQGAAFVLVDQGETDIGFGHGQTAQRIGHGLGFGPVGAQEFQPRGGGKEQVAQFDHRAAIARRRPHRPAAAADRLATLEAML